MANDQFFLVIGDDIRDCAGADGNRRLTKTKLIIGNCSLLGRTLRFRTLSRDAGEGERQLLANSERVSGVYSRYGKNHEQGAGFKPEAPAKDAACIPSLALQASGFNVTVNNPGLRRSSEIMDHQKVVFH